MWNIIIDVSCKDGCRFVIRETQDDQPDCYMIDDIEKYYSNAWSGTAVVTNVFKVLA